MRAPIPHQPSSPSRATTLPPHPRRPLRSAERKRVDAIMSRDVVTVHQDLSVDALVALLVERGRSRVPVVDDEQRLVGMVATTDLITETFLRGDTGEVVEEAAVAVPLPGAPNVHDAPAGFHVHVAGTLVGEIMSRPVVSLPASATVAEAARLMAVHHLHGLPVVSDDGRVVGLVCASDVAAWVAGL